MAITGKSVNMELFYVTYINYKGEPDTYMASKKEVQSELTSYNKITKIERAIITKGDEVDIEYFKPVKYKGKPWTYNELRNK